MNDTNNKLLWCADRIGARLCRDAIWAHDRCNWLSPAMEFQDGQWQVIHRTYGPDLYSGTSGIALFLSYLYQYTEEPLYKQTAVAALANAEATQSQFSPETFPGFYSGGLGAAYAFYLCATLLNNENYISKAELILNDLVKQGPRENSIDLIMGSAGAIPVLICLYAKNGKYELIDLATQHADLLLKKAHRTDYGWSWDTLSMEGQRHLTGFAHGAAGIAWAFLELYNVTLDLRYLEAAKEGIHYEQEKFSEQHKNWPDFRDQSWMGNTQNEPSFGIAWCHGAGGIGLSRLRALEILADEQYSEQAQIAIETTLSFINQISATPGIDFTYCHGFTGNAELLLYASQVFNRNDYLETITQITLWGIQNYEEKGIDWPCGVIGAKEVPNLFLGIAGLGHFMLRLLDPDKVDSIIMVHPNQENVKKLRVLVEKLPTSEISA